MAGSPHRLCPKVLSGGQSSYFSLGSGPRPRLSLCPGGGRQGYRRGDLNPAPPKWPRDTAHLPRPPRSGSPGSRAHAWRPRPPNCCRCGGSPALSPAPGEGSRSWVVGPSWRAVSPSWRCQVPPTGCSHRKGAPGGFPCASPSPTSSALAWVPAAGAPLGRQSLGSFGGTCAAHMFWRPRPVPATAGAWGHSTALLAEHCAPSSLRPLTLLEGQAGCHPHPHPCSSSY